MNRILISLVVACLLTGCSMLPKREIVKKDVELVQSPVPFCPAPPEFKVNKENGTEFIKNDTPPGNVAKSYEYEVAYNKGLIAIQAAIIDMYRRNAIDVDKFKAQIEQMIKETNTKLQGIATQPQPTK